MLRTWRSYFVRALIVLFLASSAAYASGVLWYQGPAVFMIRAWMIALWLALAIACAIRLFNGKDFRPFAGYAVVFVGLVLWFSLLEPRNDRIWSPEMARTLSYSQSGNEIVVTNVRNFHWTGAETAEEHWEMRRYNLRKLSSVDVLSLYWKGPRVAHTYFSFVWANGEALSLSVEIRKEQGEAYSPIGGFFKAYEIAVLAGDERDFYGWRVFFPTEDIQLFRTRATPAETQRLLLELLDLANGLAKKPAFYNTLTNNCTTEAWLLTDALGKGRPYDWRTLASGYLPDMLYELKILDTAHPLSELRSDGHIMPAARVASAADLTGQSFSIALRQGVPALATSSN